MPGLKEFWGPGAISVDPLSDGKHLSTQPYGFLRSTARVAATQLHAAAPHRWAPAPMHGEWHLAHSLLGSEQLKQLLATLKLSEYIICSAKRSAHSDQGPHTQALQTHVADRSARSLSSARGKTHNVVIALILGCSAPAGRHGAAGGGRPHARCAAAHTLHKGFRCFATARVQQLQRQTPCYCRSTTPMMLTLTISGLPAVPTPLPTCSCTCKAYTWAHLGECQSSHQLHVQQCLLLH